MGNINSKMKNKYSVIKNELQKHNADETYIKKIIMKNINILYYDNQENKNIFYLALFFQKYDIASFLLDEYNKVLNNFDIFNDEHCKLLYFTSKHDVIILMIETKNNILITKYINYCIKFSDYYKSFINKEGIEYTIFNLALLYNNYNVATIMFENYFYFIFNDRILFNILEYNIANMPNNIIDKIIMNTDLSNTSDNKTPLYIALKTNQIHIAQKIIDAPNFKMEYLYIWYNNENPYILLKKNNLSFIFDDYINKTNKNNKNNKNNKTYECIICLEICDKLNIILPCGHGVYCDKCIINIIVCALCSNKKVSTSKIFIN